MNNQEKMEKIIKKKDLTMGKIRKLLEWSKKEKEDLLERYKKTLNPND